MNYRTGNLLNAVRSSSHVKLFSSCLLKAKYSTLLFVLLFSPLFSSSEMEKELLNFEELAVNQNLALIAKKLDAKISEADITTANLRPNPYIVGNVDGNYNKNDRGGQGQVDLFYQFETFGKRKYRVKAARLDAEVTGMTIQDEIRKLLYNVRMAYLDCLEARAVLEIEEINYSSYKKLVDLNRIRLGGQQISVAEYSRSFLAMSEAEFARDDALLNVRKTSEAFRLLLGKSEPVTIRSTLAILQETVPEIPLLTETALNKRPDFLSMAIIKKSDMAKLQLEKANAMPNIAVGIDHQYQAGSWTGIVAQMQIPVFDRNQGAIKKAKTMVDQDEKRMNYLKQSIETEIRLAFEEHILCKNRLVKFNSDEKGDIMDHAKSIQKAFDVAYKSGQISLLEILDAIRTYAQTSLAYQKAISRFNKSIYAIDYSIGVNNNITSSEITHDKE